MNYEIIIRKEDWDEIYNSARLNNDGMRITSSYVSIFEQEVNKYESSKLKLYYRMGRIYEKVERRGTPYFTGNCFCSVCKTCYKFIIKTKPTASLVTVNVETSEEHNKTLHDEASLKIKTKQIRGMERETIAKDIIVTQGGSSKDYRFSKISEAASYDDNGSNYANYSAQVPSAEVYRKVKSDFRKEGCLTAGTDWLSRLREIGDTISCTVDGKLFKGYLRELMTINEFTMYLNMERQLEALHTIPADQRLVFCDSTGGLVNIPDEVKQYKRILNYVTKVKDLRLYNTSLETKSAIINEMVTSRHDTYRCKDMFEYLKSSFLQRYPSDQFKFRLITTDYSWALMHGILEAVMNETVIQYAERVFKLSKNEIEIDCGKSWLCSCCSHTMHRFSNSLRQITNDKNITKFAAYSFSLLLNATDLASISEYF